MERKNATLQRMSGMAAAGAGAIHAGVRIAVFAAGALEIMPQGMERIHVVKAPNEKSGFEIATGVTAAGARCLITATSAGLNLGCGALIAANATGISGGLVVVVVDTPAENPQDRKAGVPFAPARWEQDARSFGAYAGMAVLDPSTPAEVYEMTAEAFHLSERIGRPVLLRLTSRLCSTESTVEILPPGKVRKPHGFHFEDGKPHSLLLTQVTAKKNKQVIWHTVQKLPDMLSDFPGNRLEDAEDADIGIACGGISYTYVSEALRMFANPPPIKVLKAATAPIPSALMESFLWGLETVFVFEELNPFIEDEIRLAAFRGSHPVDIIGKHSGLVPIAGELSSRLVASTLGLYLRMTPVVPDTVERGGGAETLRQPVNADGCKALFSHLHSLKAADNRMPAVCTDLPTAEGADVCFCRGAAISAALGLTAADKTCPCVAVTTESLFLHSGIAPLRAAVLSKASLPIIILTDSEREIPDLPALLHALGAASVTQAACADAQTVTDWYTAADGLRVLVVPQP
ncbi:MAG: hypothetical protein LBR73_05250 [Oscillospiraceae bacterium]|nr:hypothetical protein [Oscillospiraceae bacterium]